MFLWLHDGKEKLLYLVKWSRSEVASPVGRPTFTKYVRIGEEIAFECRILAYSLLYGIKVIGKSAEANFRPVETALVCVHEIENALVVAILLIPFKLIIVTEIVSDQS